MMRGFDTYFYMPHSRHAGTDIADVRACKDISILAASDATGPSIMMERDGREIYITGHMEYNPETLDTEYRRDLGKRDDVEKPINYYKDDDPEKGPVVTWRAHANLLFHNWINYYVYQKTPYNIDEIN
jgi:homoserine O-succinyltransferase